MQQGGSARAGGGDVDDDGAAAVEPAGRTHSGTRTEAAAPSFGLPSLPVVGESRKYSATRSPIAPARASQ